MSDEFTRKANEILSFTEKGVQLLLEVHRLLNTAKENTNDSYLKLLVQTLAEKQKLAVQFIQNATTLEKELLREQKYSIEELIDII
jgi:hypothetical protein